MLLDDSLGTVLATFVQHILYHPLQILFDHDKKVDVVTASVNEEKTLLGKVLVLTCEVYHVILYSSCRAAERGGGGGGGQIAPGPEVLGAPDPDPRQPLGGLEQLYSQLTWQNCHVF